MSSPAQLTVRNLHFVTDPARVPRTWHPGGRAITTFFNNLSIFFPAGERFFIAAVNAHRHHVSDPQLLAEVRDFCAQEAVHRREHRRYNDMLEVQGYPVQQMEGRVERLLGRLSRITPRRWRLAATCALEHYTASLAHLVLNDPRVLGEAHPVMARLWHWHALEESEHKAVAFEVHQAAGGTQLERGLIMVIASVIFWSKVLEQQVRLMAVDGIATSPREWWSLARFLMVDPGGLSSLFWMYLDYYRPGFHPWQLDNRELLARHAAAQAVAPAPAPRSPAAAPQTAAP